MRLSVFAALAAMVLLAGCGTTHERTVVVNPPATQQSTVPPGSTVVTPQSGETVVVPNSQPSTRVCTGPGPCY